MSNHRSNQIGSRFPEPPVYCTPGSNLPNTIANNNSKHGGGNDFSAITNLAGLTIPDLQKVLAQCSNPAVSPGLSDNGTRDSLDSLRSNGSETHSKTVIGILQQLDEVRKERESHLRLIQTLQEKENRLFIQLRVHLQGTSHGNALPSTQEMLNSLEPTGSPSRSPPLATTQKPHKSSHPSKTLIDPADTDEDGPEPPRKKPGPKSKTMPNAMTPKKPSAESDRGIGKRSAPNKPSFETPTKKLTPVTTGVKQSRPAKITAKKRQVSDNGIDGPKNQNEEVSNRTSTENSPVVRNSSDRSSIGKTRDDSKQIASTSNQDRGGVQRSDASTDDGPEEPEEKFNILERTLAQIEATDEEPCNVSISQPGVLPSHPPPAILTSSATSIDSKPVIGNLASTSTQSQLQSQNDLPGSNVADIAVKQIKKEKIDPPPPPSPTTPTPPPAAIKIKTEKE